MPLYPGPVRAVDRQRRRSTFPFRSWGVEPIHSRCRQADRLMCKRLLVGMLLVGIYAILVLPLIFWERPTCGFVTLLALALYALLALQFSADFVEILLA